jgi:hypothetical protein
VSGPSFVVFKGREHQCVCYVKLSLQLIGPVVAAEAASVAAAACSRPD